MFLFFIVRSHEHSSFSRELPSPEILPSIFSQVRILTQSNELRIFSELQTFLKSPQRQLKPVIRCRRNTPTLTCKRESITLCSHFKSPPIQWNLDIQDKRNFMLTCESTVGLEYQAHLNLNILKIVIEMVWFWNGQDYSYVVQVNSSKYLYQ